MAITNRSVAEKASSKRKNSDPPSPSSSSAPEKRVRKEPSRLVLDRSSLTRIYESTNKSESVSSPSSSTTSSSSKLLNIVVDDKKKPLPVRNDKGQLLFADRPEFRPNKTPKEVLDSIRVRVRLRVHINSKYYNQVLQAGNSSTLNSNNSLMLYTHFIIEFGELRILWRNLLSANPFVQKNPIQPSPQRISRRLVPRQVLISPFLHFSIFQVTHQHRLAFQFLLCRV